MVVSLFLDLVDFLSPEKTRDKLSIQTTLKREIKLSNDKQTSPSITSCTGSLTNCDFFSLLDIENSTPINIEPTSN